MKLSKRSDEFVRNVRMYLFTSGKNEQDIEDVIGELEDHLSELESRGKSVESITAGSPTAYMESLEEEMTNDYASWLKYIPIFGMFIIAYSMMGPALSGTFEMNLIQLIGLPSVTVVSVIIYWALFRNMAKKELSGKKGFLASFMAVLVVQLLFIAIVLASSLLMDPSYTASATMNKVIVGLCTIAFIGGAVWLKEWVAIVIPILLFVPQVVFQYTSFSDEWKLIGAWVISMVLIVSALFLYLRVLKKKETAE